MRSLPRLQQWLQRVYEIEVEYDVMDFLITDRKLVMALQGEDIRPDCPEKLLLRESPEEMAMSLYLAPKYCRRWAVGIPRAAANGPRPSVRLSKE